MLRPRTDRWAHSRPSLRRSRAGGAPAARIIPGNSAPNAAQKSPKRAGRAPAARLIKASSVLNAERKSRRARFCISATNAAGNLRIRRTRPNSALNAGINLTTAMLNSWDCLIALRTGAEKPADAQQAVKAAVPGCCF